MRTKGATDIKPRKKRKLRGAYKRREQASRMNPYSYVANIAMSPEMKPFIGAIYHDLLSTVHPEFEPPKSVPMWFDEKDETAVTFIEPKKKIIWDASTGIANE